MMLRNRDVPQTSQSPISSGEAFHFFSLGSRRPHRNGVVRLNPLLVAGKHSIPVVFVAGILGANYGIKSQSPISSGEAFHEKGTGQKERKLPKKRLNPLLVAGKHSINRRRESGR